MYTNPETHTHTHTHTYTHIEIHTIIFTYLKAEYSQTHTHTYVRRNIPNTKFYHSIHYYAEHAFQYIDNHLFDMDGSFYLTINARKILKRGRRHYINGVAILQIYVHIISLSIFRRQT